MRNMRRRSVNDKAVKKDVEKRKREIYAFHISACVNW
jgi:hypothetical protein